MKTDMYNPANGAHYLASSSQVKVLEKSGWVVYADWLAAQQTATPDPTPTPDPAPAPTDTTSSAAPDSDVTLV